MLCNDDPLLKGHGFVVDDFRAGLAHVRYYFLTHAHMDHMNGLRSLSKRCDGRCVVYASSDTIALIRVSFPTLKADLRVLEIGKPVVLDDVRVDVLPASHCPGSVMFLFTPAKSGAMDRWRRVKTLSTWADYGAECERYKGSDGSVLVTGDYRFPVGIDLELFNPMMVAAVDRVYHDDTFLGEATGSGVPEKEVTWTSIEDIGPLLARKMEHALARGPVYLHMAVMGFEPHVRGVCRAMGIDRVALDPRLSSIRAEQIRMLLGDLLLEQGATGYDRAEVILSERRLPQSEPWGFGTWILPTCAGYLCLGLTPEEDPGTVSGEALKVVRVPYCTHAPLDESRRFLAMVGARTEVPMGFAIGRLRCHRDSNAE